jgi:hypothetical protein
MLRLHFGTFVVASFVVTWVEADSIVEKFEQNCYQKDHNRRWTYEMDCEMDGATVFENMGFPDYQTWKQIED